MHCTLLPAVIDNDERAGYPSASEYGRLLKCRASYLMAKKARALGQVAHERSDAADLGTKLHLANVEGPDILSAEEREDWETCQRKAGRVPDQWTADCALPVEVDQGRAALAAQRLAAAFERQAGRSPAAGRQSRCARSQIRQPPRRRSA